MAHHRRSRMAWFNSPSPARQRPAPSRSPAAKNSVVSHGKSHRFSTFPSITGGRFISAAFRSNRRISSARINALIHQVDSRVEAREGDLFAPVGDERFDRILFNPPFYRREPRDMLERAFFATDVVERFAAAPA